MDVFSIAIDGPAGAGKSTVAKAVAERLNADYLDTGAMYRAIGLYMLRRGIDPADMEKVGAACLGAEIDVKYVSGVQHTLLMGEDVSEAIRSEECSRAASMVSKVSGVRDRLVTLQREIARGRRLVMDGRDIGTRVLTDARVKIFLTASAEVRARRRYDEIVSKGGAADFGKVLADIQERDYQDMHRAISPLVRAEDAVEVDTSDMTISEVIEKITGIAEGRA